MHKERAVVFITSAVFWKDLIKVKSITVNLGVNKIAMKDQVRRGIYRSAKF